MIRPLVPALALALAACAVPQSGQRAAPAAGPLPRYTVFFTEWSGRLDDAAVSTIAAAADAAKGNPRLPVTVAGYADTVGSEPANQAVSTLRAQLITDQLIADGVPAGRIIQSGRGGTTYIASSQESRRAVISVGTP